MHCFNCSIKYFVINKNNLGFCFLNNLCKLKLFLCIEKKKDGKILSEGQRLDEINHSLIFRIKATNEVVKDGRNSRKQYATTNFK